MEPRIGKTIFLSTGATFTFYEVDNIEENEHTLEFRYIARSDNRTKTAVFYRKMVAGHSSFQLEA